ncbi:MAG: hypothetical protein ACI9C4_002012 [Paraglaciecola sp.]
MAKPGYLNRWNLYSNIGSMNVHCKSSALSPHQQGPDFVEQVLEYFNISYALRDNEREPILSHSRLAIIANHPIGSLDALAHIKLLSEITKEIKVIANEMLMTTEPLHFMLLPVNNIHGGIPEDHIHSIQAHLKVPYLFFLQETCHV